MTLVVIVVFLIKIKIKFKKRKRKKRHESCNQHRLSLHSPQCPSRPVFFSLFIHLNVLVGLSFFHFLFTSMS